MRRAVPLLALAAACWGRDAYIVEGVVVDVLSPTRIVVDHEAIPGFMDAMVMPFHLADDGVAPGLVPGDRIVARLDVSEGRAVLEKVRVVGRGPAPVVVAPPGAPVRVGEVLPAVQVPVTGGGAWTVGAGQDAPTALTFLYTTCPIPEFCPAVVTRLQGLQAKLGDGARILAVTLDPEGDTLPVLEAFATTVGARPEAWRFGRLEVAALEPLLGHAALSRMAKDGEVLHALRLLVLDREGRLVERYDDNRWPEDRVLTQLRTGAPKGDPASSGTLTPAP